MEKIKMVTGVFQSYNRLKPDGEIEKSRIGVSLR